MAVSDSKKWLIFAIASGACAAINGVFAKLTTTTLTTTIASHLSHAIGLSHSTFFELVVRGSCFGLNLLFDAIMWGLFTRALTLASSTVHVSVLNTSTNFLVAATAGWVVFGESLPGLWWLGAVMLIAGCYVIGRREKGKDEGKQTKTVRTREDGQAVPDGAYVDEGIDRDAVDLDKLDEPDAPLPRARSRSPYRDREVQEPDTDDDGYR